MVNKKFNVLPGNEAAAAELEARLKAIEAEKAAIEAARSALTDQSEHINAKLYKVESSGNAGVIITGLGKSQFFYPTHLMLLIGESEQAERVRAKLRKQVEEMRTQLTWGKKQ